MPVVIIYSSAQACSAALTVATRLASRGYLLRHLAELPTPRPVRVASLRLELAALQQIERTIRWVLSQYTEGLRLPDACRESDLRADLEVTLWQLHRVATALHASTVGEGLA